MIELELLLNELERLYAKEKGLRRKIFLENAIKNLKEYEKSSR